jgi:hypothetical protein
MSNEGLARWVAARRLTVDALAPGVERIVHQFLHGSGQVRDGLPGYYAAYRFRFHGTNLAMRHAASVMSESESVSDVPPRGMRGAYRPEDPAAPFSSYTRQTQT